MSESGIDVLRDVQLSTAELPWKTIRGSFSGWLLAHMLASWPEGVHSGLTFRLLFVVLGLRLAGWTLRRHPRLGYVLGSVVLLLGFLPSLVRLLAGLSSPTWLLYTAIVGIGFGLGGARSIRAIRDLERYGAHARTETESRLSPPA